MLQIVLLVVSICLIINSLWKLGSRNHDYFKKKGIKYLKPFPFIGTNGWMLKRKNIVEMLQIAYSSHPDEKVIGTYDYLTPIYFIRDPKLVKQITIKDFDHFVDRRALVDPNDDKVLGNVLTSLKGQRWREMRSSLSPTFTGSKMRLMFGFVANCCEQLVEYFQQDYKKTGKQQVYDIKDIISRYTNDVVASCAFGVKCDSLKDRDNDFYKTGQALTKFFGPAMLFKFALLRLVPKVAKFFDVSIVDSKTTQKFRAIILDQMKIREKENIVRPDMINLLMQLRKGNLNKIPVEEDENHEIAAVENKQLEGAKIKTHWVDDELVAQCLQFFFAGFEATSRFLQFLAYELAVNPDVQKKLAEEIFSIREDLQNKPMEYEALYKMKYLDMVITEALRKWTPVPLTERVCVKDYKYMDPDGLELNIEKGRVIQIPLYSLLNDAEYFPNPEKFDPERFNDENKKDISFDAYLPFGIGPRNCIGSRFALMVIKSLIYFLLSDFVLDVCEQTQIPIKLKKGVLAIVPEKKIYLALTPRQ